MTSSAPGLTTQGPPGDPALADLSRALFFIRGLAIALVVAGHVIGFDREFGMRQAYSSDLGWLGKFCDLLNTFHMPIFFIASGSAFFVFSKKDTDFAAFLRSKFSKLLVPLLIWAPLYFIAQHLVKHQPFNAAGVALSVIFPYEIFWFIHALLSSTLLAYLCFKYLKSRTLYLLISALSIVPFFYFKPVELGWFDSFAFWNLFYAFGVFIAAYILALHKMMERAPALALATIALVLLALMIQTHFYMPIGFARNERFVNGPAGFFLLYIGEILLARFLAAATFSAAVPDFVVRLGAASMAIYLFHSYFTRGMALAIQKTLGLPRAEIYFLVVWSAGVLGPYFLDKFLQPRSGWYVFSIGGTRRQQSS